ncbi:MAG TPA: endonuclease [Actinomycetales bacterium]|nr:endonuclease [Actinomycetales bacterium]
MASQSRERVLRTLLSDYGATYAADAGIRLRDAPSPLYRLLVLTVLLSARISSSLGVAAARELSQAGLRTAASMADATWQQRVDALGRAGYRRFDERTATMLGDGAHLVLERWKGDLRRLRAESDGDVEALRRGLQDLPGIGPLGSAVFCREVQGVWPEVAPFVDDRAASGAQALGLPRTPSALARLVPPDDLPRLVAACVRASLDDDVVTAVLT